uniref:Rubisco LSMT substrate-binding domain-containing protein n=1 Tax=Palpitomonas bilix TaxID=652834 RepID=A0A7S3D846_9EUKA
MRLPFAFTLLLAAFLLLAAIVHPTSAALRRIGRRADGDIEEYEKWLRREVKKRRGTPPSSLQLSYFEGMGLGVRAVEDVQKGEELVRMPLSLVFCRETIQAMPTPFGRYIARPDNQGVSDTQKMALALLYEDYRQDGSLWEPYLHLLPSQLDSTVFFSEEELDELDGLVIAGESRSEKKRMEEQVEYVKKRMLQWEMKDERFAMNAMTIAEFANELNVEDYTLATYLIHSRAWTMKRDKYLLPFSDFLNHDKADFEETSESFLLYHSVEDGFAVMKAEKAYAKGMQVFESYGSNPNHIYLRYHGFLPADNDATCAQFVLSPQRAMRKAKKRDVRMVMDRLFSEAQMEYTVSACVRRSDFEEEPSGRRRVHSQKMMTFFRIMSLSESGAREVKRGRINPRKPGTATQEAAAWSKMAEYIEERLNGVTKRNSGDEALLEKGMLTGRKELAVKYRVAEVREMEDMLAYAKEKAKLN